MNCCTFLEPASDTLLVTVAVVEAAATPSERGARLTYPPPLPPPRQGALV